MKPTGGLRILVTDAHTLAGLGVLRSLGRAGHRVVAAYPQGLDRPASTWSRYCSGVASYPSAQYHHFEFRDWLRDQAHRGRFDAILPVTEPSIVGVAALRKELPSDLLPILPSDEALKYTLSKFHSTQLALSLGIPCPATVFVHDGTPTAERHRDFSVLPFPIVIKTDNHLTEEGIYEAGRTFAAPDAAAARRILARIERVGPRVIAQQMIPGRGTGAFLLRFNGKTRLSFAHRRLHEVPHTGGMSSFRQGCRDEELVRLAEMLLGAIEYAGVAMVEFRRSSTDGKPYFLEINGRFWGSLALSLHSGVDFPAALIECYQRGDCRGVADQYRTGIRCRNFPGELGHLVSILRTPTTSPAGSSPSKIRALAAFFLLSLDPTIRHDYFWWSDPRPGLRQAQRTALWLGQKVLATARRKLRASRDERILKRVVAEHRLRCRQAKYFDRPLNTILFLCYGNICRSPFAAERWNAIVRESSLTSPTAISAGFHPRPDRRAPSWIAKLAQEHDIDLTRHRSRVLGRAEVKSADAVFVMDLMNYRDLARRFPWAKAKIFFLGPFAEDGEVEIDDPYDEDPYSMRNEVGHRCYQKVVRALEGLRAQVLREASGNNGTR